MNNRESPLFWSFSCGIWFQTRVRISYYFPLLVLLICWRLKSVELGLIFSGILFLSVLVHEFGHIVAVRLTGGSGNDILMWPLGGLAFVQPFMSFKSRLLTPAGGPLVNLALCGITLPAVIHSGLLSKAIHPLEFPLTLAELSNQPVGGLLLLTFWANWFLLLVNLIPVFPFDGGRMLQVVLMSRWEGERERATEIYIRIGFFVGFIGLFAGLLADSTWIVAIGAFMLLLNMQESFQLRAGESYDESFMGYDFSQGYTSLEQSEEVRTERRPGYWQRWREKRRTEKQQRLQEKAVEVEQQLDELLSKVHRQGIESLTDAERHLLNRASARFRDKDKHSESS